MPPERERLVRRTLRLFGTSWRAHLDHPLVVAIVIGGCVLLHTLDELTGRRDPGAGDLSRLFAPPPLDLYSGVRVADGSPWMLAAMIPARAAFLLAVLTMILGVRPNAVAFLKVTGLKLAELLSFAVVVVTGNLYFAEKAAAIEDPSRSLAPLFLIMAQPVLFVVFTAILAPLVCQSAGRVRMRLVVSNRALWIFAAVSVWMWLFGKGRIDAIAAVPGGEVLGYGLAFGVLILQSVILGAIAFSAIEASQAADKVKFRSSAGALVRAPL